MVGTLKRAKLHYHVRCRRNRSNRGQNLAIFHFPRWRGRHIGFSKFQIFNGRSRRSNCVAVPNLVKIGQTDFSRWRLPPSWIFNFFKNNSWNPQEGETASPCQISSKSVKPRPEYGDFSIFQYGSCHHHGFSNFQRSAASRGSTCVAMPNLVEIGRTVADVWRFFIFPRWRPSAILDLFCG